MSVRTPKHIVAMESAKTSPERFSANVLTKPTEVHSQKMGVL